VIPGVIKNMKDSTLPREIKIYGNVFDDFEKLSSFLKENHDTVLNLFSAFVVRVLHC